MGNVLGEYLMEPYQFENGTKYNPLTKDSLPATTTLEIVLQLLQTVHVDLQEVRTEQKNMSKTLTEHINAEPEEWAALLKDTLGCAFPGGDAEGHRKYHEETIYALEARSEFWKKMLFEITKYGLFGVLGWLAYTVWAAFLHGPSK